MLPNSINTVTAFTAILAADRVPAIINYTASKESIRKAISKTGVYYIITSRSFVEKLSLDDIDCEFLFIEDMCGKNIPLATRIMWSAAAALLPSAELMRLASPISYSDVSREAVIIFSSGSTGTPKGVVLTHHNVNADVTSVIKTIGWNKHDRIIGNLPLFHSFGLNVCMWMPLISGTETTMTPNVLDGITVGEILKKQKITVMASTPGFMQIYMRKCDPSVFSSLRLAITGAEKLREDMQERFYALTGLSIAEGYGCSELSPIVSINLANSRMELGVQVAELGSIGPPLPGVCVKIVAPDTFELLPENSDGLMIVKGAIVMKGYLGDPQKTAEVIKDNYYITGDIARMNRNGFITITGRLSRFSKIAGEMVPHELVEKEINAILRPEERLLAVVGASDPKRGEKLLVFYTDKERLDPESVVAEMRKKGIPNLWIPKCENFIYVSELPMLGSGKLDLASLAEMAVRLAV
jgi:acyl-[acyl-carrier-protein]-phospholipid O-acyltransferase/long-chain-fatty-acid--[acyl-carrier-protein] ligase